MYYLDFRYTFYNDCLIYKFLRHCLYSSIIFDLSSNDFYIIIIGNLKYINHRNLKYVTKSVLKL